MPALFDRYALFYNSISVLFTNPKKHADTVIRLSKAKQSDNVLDVGGGTGIVAEYVAPHVKFLTIVDPSAGMLERVPKIKNLKARVGIAQKLSFKSAVFDIVYCVDALHHFTNEHSEEEPEKIVDVCADELLRVLNKDGRMVIIEVDVNRAGGKLVKFLENSVLKMRSCFFSRAELEQMFRKKHCTVRTHAIDWFAYAAVVTQKVPKAPRLMEDGIVLSSKMRLSRRCMPRASARG